MGTFKSSNKKLMSAILSFFMVFSMITPVTINATVNVDKNEYTSNDIYSYIVSATTGGVVTNQNEKLNVGEKITDGNELDVNQLFKIEEDTNVSRFQIISVDTNRVWKSNPELVANGDKQGSLHLGSWEGFEFEAVASVEGAIRIKNYAGNYVGVVDGTLTVTDGNVANSEIFYVVAPRYDDISIYIEHVETENYVTVSGVSGDAVLVNGTNKDALNARYDVLYGTFDGSEVVNFQSKEFGNITWKSGGSDKVTQLNAVMASGWESIIAVPNGDGTISFKSSQDKSYITVNAKGEMVKGYTGEITDNEKFVIHSVLKPNKVTNVSVTGVEETRITVSFDEVTQSIYTGYKVIATPDISTGLAQIVSEEILDTEVTLEGLQTGTKYEVTVEVVNGESASSTSDSIEITTLSGPRPINVSEIEVTEAEEGLEVAWGAVEGAISYDVYRARSAYDKDGYTKIAEDVTETSFVDISMNANKYQNYYKVVAKNGNGESDLSFVHGSLESTMFGYNTIILAETDSVSEVDRVVLEVFNRQHDIEADAQFNQNRYTIYFKPGDYTETSNMQLGYYTQFAGLGQTPYEVKLNNVSIPAYLDNFNATCNFWRGAENFSIIDTGNEQGMSDGSWRPDHFNWGVAQAAPLRRVYSERVVSYDWNYGWASGGYVADSYFVGIDGEGRGAGTHSGQQFYTRNTEVVGDVYGTTLNAFYQGVVAPNLPNATNGTELLSGEGYTNWGILSPEGNEQVVTSITVTEEMREKPFLFLDSDGEYKIFVPSIKENSKGTSWSKDNIGEGEAHSLDGFYIAKEGDTAAEINAQLEAGKNIFFTPGIYYAEEPILVNNPNTIVLGTGMATVIPMNSETAMKVADQEGIIIAGIILDAGPHSEYLLIVGDEDVKSTSNTEENPIFLIDLFFRIGGTTDELTKADDVIVINADNTVTDHFWIWRADHGAGVEWYGNESAHGLIVNADNVTCYALFNEHFQKYHTLWNGEDGKTYFYQNETAYDPISQEDWMSHKGTVNGYSSYKVSNKVDNHYAVGMGVYNVFIFTGPSYDSTEVQITLDNAIEVPNKEGVLIENACIQTFADNDKVFQEIASIINGTGESVSSGTDKETGEVGTGWDRKYILSYQNGVTTRGTIANPIIEYGVQPMNEPGDVNLDLLVELYNNNFEAVEENYTSESWESFELALEEARIQIEDKGLDWANQDDVDVAYEELLVAINNLVEKPEVEEPETEKPETEDPEVEEPETEKPETEDPEIEEPETEKPETEKPEELPQTGGYNTGIILAICLLAIATGSILFKKKVS